MKSGARVRRRPRKKDVVTKVVEKFSPYDVFKEKFEKIFKGKVWIDDILGLMYENGKNIFNQYDRDVTYQLVNSLKENEKKTLEFLKKRAYKDEKDLYWNLDVFANADALTINEDNNNFHVVPIYKSGIVCERPSCGRDSVQTINVGPTSGDEASAAVYYCPYCNWQKRVK